MTISQRADAYGNVKSTSLNLQIQGDRYAKAQLAHAYEHAQN